MTFEQALHRRGQRQRGEMDPREERKKENRQTEGEKERARENRKMRGACERERESAKELLAERQRPKRRVLVFPTLLCLWF